MNFVLGTGAVQLKHVRRADDCHFENSITDPAFHAWTILIKCKNSP